MPAMPRLMALAYLTMASVKSEQQKEEPRRLQYTAGYLCQHKLTPARKYLIRRPTSESPMRSYIEDYIPGMLSAFFFHSVCGT